ncbi:MAG: hypothetical protein Tsb0027_03540 [Wenzhouxiangellaceae bacterium]
MRPAIHSLIVIGMLLGSSNLAHAQNDQSDQSGAGQASVEQAAKTRFPQALPKRFDLLQGMAATALTEDNTAEFVRILEHAQKLYPYDHRIMVQLVAGYALQDEKTKAYNLMLGMQQQGIGFDFNQLPQTENIRGTESYQYINDLLISNAEGASISDRAFTLPPEARLTEAISFDSQSQHFIIGTVREPGIMVLDQSGVPVVDAPDFNRHVAHAVFDLAVDASRRHLWASTSAVPQQVGYKSSDFGKNALLKLDLDSGDLLASYRIKPDGSPHGMGNIALASDGTVYLADLRSPTIYELPPDAEQLTVLAVGPALPNIHGIALNEQEQLLYLADQNRGLAFIDLRDNRPYLMGAPETLNLGGIEGIDYWNNHLIIIQPGMRPARVMQILLGNNGRNIVTAEPIDANHEDYHAPNFGVIAGDHYHYLAASHWTAYDLQGNRLPGSKVDAVPVLKFPLLATDPSGQARPELQDILRRRAEQQRSQVPELLRPPADDGD